MRNKKPYLVTKEDWEAHLEFRAWVKSLPGREGMSILITETEAESRLKRGLSLENFSILKIDKRGTWGNGSISNGGELPKRPSIPRK